MSVRIEDLPLWAQVQVRQKLAAENRAAATETKNKYGAERTEISGIKFDSKKEARRFSELMRLHDAGLIRDLRLQQDFTLQEAYTTPEGKRIRAIRYRADFVYEEKTKGEVWAKVVEDVKSTGTRTKEYAMKKKMMADKYGIQIREV